MLDESHIGGQHALLKTVIGVRTNVGYRSQNLQMSWINSGVGPRRSPTARNSARSPRSPMESWIVRHYSTLTWSWVLLLHLIMPVSVTTPPPYHASECYYYSTLSCKWVSHNAPPYHASECYYYSTLSCNGVLHNAPHYHASECYYYSTLLGEGEARVSFRSKIDNIRKSIIYENH